MAETGPTTKAGQALAGWNSRSQSMAETIVRIEREAVANWLGSAEAERRLAEALRQHGVRSGDGAELNVREILEVLRDSQAG